jgi:prephenate dehydrogenase
LIGASLGAAGRRAGVLAQVVGVGRDPANLQTALGAGCVDAFSTDLEASLNGAGLVVLAVPVTTALSLLPAVVAHTGDVCVVTDVGSVKGPVCAAAARAGAEARFVGAHPMAGSTRSGAAYADADLFVGKVAVLTPMAHTSADSIATVEALWNAVGSRVVTMDSAEHDRTVALSSHLPQMLAYCLADTAARCSHRERLDDLIAGGFKLASRLATSDTAMWSSIAELNASAIVEAMDEFSQSWARLREAIAAGDAQAIESILDEARNLRESLDK